eukprot:g6690.t1
MQDMRSREKRIKGDKNVKFTPILSQKQQDEQKNRSLETVNNNINVTNTFFRRPFRNCNRFWRSRCRNIKRIQLDICIIIISLWFLTLYFAVNFGNQLSFDRHANFLKRNICFDGVSGQRPFAEHEGKYDMNARAQMVYEVDKWLYRNNSKIGQKIEVFSNNFFGKVLVVEDEIMITEKDERHYHEMIAHVPLAYFNGIQNVRVLIIGGGDGGTLFQVLKHPNVRHVTMVELDEDVVKVSKKYFPEFAKSYDDPRVTLIIDDGAKFVSERLGMKYLNLEEAEPLEIQIASQKGIKNALPENEFEIIIVDSTDYGPAIPLFTRQFYMHIQELLNDENSILVFNCDSPSWAFDTVTHVSSLISSVYERNYLYQVFQPTYVSGYYTFMFASDNIHPVNTQVNWDTFKKKNIQTRYYNKGIHEAAFYLPQFLKDAVPHKDI